MVTETEKGGRKVRTRAIVAKQPDSSVETFISAAIEKQLPVETMERLFALREKALAERAKSAFVQALAEFQRECPVIKKSKEVKGKDGRLRYKYEPLDGIIRQVKDALGKHGLSYKFDEKRDESTTTAICTATHIDGHSEQTSFTVPIGTEEYMTDVQKYGARMTFAKRYAFCNAFGILTGDEDLDGLQTNKEQDAKSYKSKIMLRLRTLKEKTDTKEEVEGAVKRLTKLDLEEENYPSIADRLQAIIDERNQE